MKHFLSFLAALTICSAARAAVIPYTNTFDTGGLTTTTPDQWTIQSGVYVNTAPVTSSVSASTASLQLTNATSASFTITTQFSVPSVSGVTNSGSGYRAIGLGFYGKNDTLSGTASNPTYLALYSFSAGTGAPYARGSLTLESRGDSEGFTSTSASAFDPLASGVNAIQFDTIYTLKLTVSFDSFGTLLASFGLYDATGITLIGTTAIASDTSPLTGSYFGYRNLYRTSSGTADQTVNFQSYSIVPEPGALALIPVAAGLFLLMRLRRSPGKTAIRCASASLALLAASMASSSAAQDTAWHFPLPDQPLPLVFPATTGQGALFLDGTHGSSPWLSGTEASSQLLLTRGPREPGAAKSGALGLRQPAEASSTKADANGKSITFQIPGAHSVLIKYAVRRSSKDSFSRVRWSYSTNGTDWTDLQTVSYEGSSEEWKTTELNPLKLADIPATLLVKATFLEANPNPSGARVFQIANIVFAPSSE